MMKQTFIFLFFLLTLLGSCSNHRMEMSRLAYIDSLMEVNAQIAYDSLSQDSGMFLATGNRCLEMKYRLLMAKAQNKLFLKMPSDSLFQEVVDYYDSKGTPNEKMEAHYLLGCIYRDLGESPKAMQCYQKAIDCVDSLNKDSYEITLARVYGQMIYIYKKQYLHNEAIRACQKFSKYSELAGDKYAYVQGQLYMASEYFEKGDTLRAIDLIKKCNSLYQRYGMYQDAARVFPKLIYVYLYRKQYQEAHYYMNIFENKSGLFDFNNNIKSGYEHYYKAKGLYFLGINQIDSAEFYYRKLGKYGFHYETAQGLLSVYRIAYEKDSVMKYSAICEQEMDKILNKKEADAVVMASSLYNYSRLQQKIDSEILQKTKLRYSVVIIGLLVLLLFVCFCWRYKAMRKKLKNMIENLTADNGLKGESLKQTRNKVAALQSNLEASEAKFKQIDLLGKKNILKNSKIVLEFKKMAFGVNEGGLPDSSDWDKLEKLFLQCHPILVDKWNVCQLSEQEIRVCMLTYLEFENKKIAILIQTSASVVSNAKKKANRKMYGSEDATSLFQNMQME